jgi:hypothetical protein
VTSDGKVVRFQGFHGDAHRLLNMVTKGKDERKGFPRSYCAVKNLSGTLCVGLTDDLWEREASLFDGVTKIFQGIGISRSARDGGR